jgi:hypothetical protein
MRCLRGRDPLDKDFHRGAGGGRASVWRSVEREGACESFSAHIHCKFLSTFRAAEVAAAIFVSAPSGEFPL